MDYSQSFANLKPRNIIVRMPNWLGDCVMATPILADLRHHWPEASITVMCQEPLGGLIQQDPHIDSILHFKRPKRLFAKNFYRTILLPIREGHYDLGILLTNSFSSAWWFWRGHVDNRIGFATHARSFLLNFPIPFPIQRKTQHLVLTYKALLEPLGIPISKTAPTLYLLEEEKKERDRLFATFGIQEKDFVLGINPGAAYGSAKCWLPDRFQQLTRELLQNLDMKIVFFGDSIGTPLVDMICSEFTKNVINLAGKTSLRQLAVMIQACDLFLTNDSGPMHIASALGVPLIALFGSTDDITTGPYRGGKVIHKHVSCSPCYRRVCPIDFRCMKQISVQEVYDGIQEFLKKEKFA